MRLYWVEFRADVCAENLIEDSDRNALNLEMIFRDGKVVALFLLHFTFILCNILNTLILVTDYLQSSLSLGAN